MRRLVSGSIYALAGAIGVLSFVYPFFVQSRPEGAPMVAHGQDAPLLTTALVGISLVALLIELQGQSMGAKMVATLGVLVAIISVLRFIDVAISLPGGFSPIFAPIILAGYAFGARFGFLLGSSTLLVSALITGGVGPWLPYQMLTSGWVGMSAGGLRSLLRRTRSASRAPSSVEVAALCVLGAIWGLLYGAIMNLYFWPFAMGPVEQTWAPGIDLGAILTRYAAFYATTSLVWDISRSVGNAALILLLGKPMIYAFDRFGRRFHFELRSPSEAAVPVEARPARGGAP